MPRRLTLLLLLLPIMPMRAQELLLEVEELPEIRRYAVEVIIFSYAQSVGTGSELFFPDEIVIEEIPLRDVMPPVIELTPNDEAVTDEPAEPPLADTLLAEPVSDIVILQEEEYTLNEIMGRLERLEVYEPIMHFGWAQSTWPEHEREALALDRFAAPPEGLEGDVTLYLSRYLHLVVDLQLEEPREDTEDAGVEDRTWSYGDYRTLNEFDDPLEPAPVHYRIEEDRIFRSGELRYFDHPKFGVLAKVTRLEEEPEELEDVEETELLGYPVE